MCYVEHSTNNECNIGVMNNFVAEEQIRSRPMAQLPELTHGTQTVDFQSKIDKRSTP